jgi:hypothetical protein
MCPQNADDWSSAGHPDWDVRIWLCLILLATGQSLKLGFSELPITGGNPLDHIFF